jgi:hypothetical protein
MKRRARLWHPPPLRTTFAHFLPRVNHLGAVLGRKEQVFAHRGAVMGVLDGDPHQTGMPRRGRYPRGRYRRLAASIEEGLAS